MPKLTNEQRDLIETTFAYSVWKDGYTRPVLYLTEPLRQALITAHENQDELRIGARVAQLMSIDPEEPNPERHFVRFREVK